MTKTYIEGRFTEQMPFVGTKLQRKLVEREAKRDKISRAAVLRRALNGYFGVDEDAEEDEELLDAS